MKKGSSSKGGSSSQKLSDKKMRKMEARVLEEKLVTLRAAVFEPDGKDRNVCAPLAPFMKRVPESSRRRRASSPGEKPVGGLFLDFEAVRDGSVRTGTIGTASTAPSTSIRNSRRTRSSGPLN